LKSSQLRGRFNMPRDVDLLAAFFAAIKIVASMMARVDAIRGEQNSGL